MPVSHAVLTCEALIRAGLGTKVTWYAYCAPEGFTRDLALLMRQAGCVGIDFGADHGDDGMLRRLGRHYTASDLIRIGRICSELGIIYMFDLLLGSPGETRASMGKAIRLMGTIAPDRVGISLGVRIYPATPLGRSLMGAAQTPPSENPHLFGDLEQNDRFLRPVFYCDADLGEDIEDWLHDLIGHDARFLLGRRTDAGLNYNYNDNSELARAIRCGHRGAYWDILRRVSEGKP